MTLRMSHFVEPGPLVVAKESGLLEGIELVETRTTGSPAQLEGLLGDQVDVVVTAIDNLFAWVGAGADVVLVGQVEATIPMGVYAAAEHSSLADLAGTRFAVDASTNGFALVARYLFRRGSIDVEYVEVGGVVKRLESLLDGTTDATLLSPPFDAQARVAGMHEIANVQRELPAFPGQGLVVQRELIGTPELEALLDAMRVSGMIGVDPVGLDLLTQIRGDLGLLPDGIALRALTV